MIQLGLIKVLDLQDKQDFNKDELDVLLIEMRK